MDMRNDDNSVTMTVKPDPDKYAKSNKNLLDIEFGKQNESNSVGISPSTKVQDILNDLPNKIKDKKSGIYIYIHGSDVEFTPTKAKLDKYIKDKIKSQLDEFIDNNPEISDEDLAYQE